MRHMSKNIGWNIAGVLALIIILFAEGLACGQTPPANPDSNALAETFHPAKLAALDSVIEEAIANSKLVGAVLWVERNGAAYHKAYGRRSPGQAPELMTEDTVFDVASVTKVVAAATAAMKAVEDGLIKLDDPVSKHLPAFTGENREEVTVRHLLLHTSGLTVNLDPTAQPFSNRDEALALICREKLQFAPGSAYCYSSVGSLLLGAVIERASGKPLDEFCTAKIFRPLRMTDTLFRPQGELLRRVAPTDLPERGHVNDNMARAIGGVAGHASLFTTAPDLARFARMMLNLGELDGSRVLRPETVRLMTSVQSPPGLRCPAANNLPVRRALGYDIDTPYRTAPHEYGLHRGAVFPIGSYGHAGWTGQALWIDPFSRTFYVFLCNRYTGGQPQPPLETYRLHHRLATLAAEAVKGFDFQHVPGALSRTPSNKPN